MKLQLKCRTGKEENIRLNTTGGEINWMYLGGGMRSVVNLAFNLRFHKLYQIIL